MRPIARQSARLASTSTQRIRASSPRSPYYASATSHTQSHPPQQRRTFHATPSSFAESRPPQGSPEHQRALEERRAADEALRQQHQQQQDQHGLESGAEARRPGAGRRSLRQRRVADVPPPPPVPEWFLRQNVVLVQDGEGGGDGGARMVRCVDSKTGHTLFTVPFYPGEAQEEKQKADAEEAGRKAQEEQAKQASIPGISMLGDNFFQQKFGGQIPPVLESKEDLPLGFKFPQAADLQASKDPLAWTLLETEASVRAAMGASAQTGAAASSHAASRSDVHLHCPDSNAHVQMDQYVRDIARTLHADLITLDANDIADLTSDYVGGGSDLPGSFGTLAYDVYDGAVANGLAIRGGGVGEQQHEAEEEDEEGEDDETVTPQDSMNLGHFGSFDELRKALGDKRHDINKALGNFGMAGVSVGLPQGVNPFAPPARQEPAQSKKPDPADYVTWDDARLLALLDGLLDAPSAAKAANLGQGSQEASTYLEDADGKKETPWAVRAGSMVAGVASKIEFAKSAASTDGKSDNVPLMKLDMVGRENAKPDLISQDGRKTIVQVRDLKQILGHKLGESIIKRLVRVVQKRRRAGEELVIIGTTSEEVTGPLDSLFDINEDSPFRMIVVPPLFDMSAAEQASFEASALPPPYRSIHDAPSYDRIASVNLRHVSSMMRRLGHDLDSRTMEESFRELKMPGTHILSEKILPQGEMQRLVLTAIGLSKSHAQSDSVTPIHIALATAILSKADHAVHSWTSFQEAQQRKNNPFIKAAPNAGGAGAPEKTPGQARIEGIKKNCNQHETRLLAGVVDPANIKTGFNDVHASPDSIEALKSMTTLSLQRPDAFEYGVLANDRLTGLLLYGPPGTGKTLLAKAVAKESGATVLEVSGAQIYEKYVGEGEKMVRAVFSLAKKISPCVVFIDEADAIFGSRGGSGNRNTHREIINQFLREWDGMDDNSVFMMVASNRPFDLDDAVLRRLPRRLLVDLPVAKDRESILGIHLRHEALDSSVDLAALSEQTPLYSGSDLKNLCVSAALAAVREENDLAAQHKDDKDFKLPEKRTLAARHFDKAVAEISASINEDMSSLTAIRKFDEQFGDRRGRKKKSAYGFGVGDEGVDENSARVRQGP